VPEIHAFKSSSLLRPRLPYVLITLLQSILSVVQMPEAGRQIIYRIVIIAMLLLDGRERIEQ
jgi:ribose/xylose/arabinose/galactoside ABC-type transport system permease subunit